MSSHEHETVNAESHSAGDAAPALFAPDLLLASQQAMARAPDSPCRRLVVAVFERALLDAVGPTARQAERDDALAWFFSDRADAFSFRWIAAQLGIEPDWLRRLIRARRPGVTAPAPADAGTRRAA